jgi:tRNA threonylcarbamoyladenosine biosynthesis protein TsaB
MLILSIDTSLKTCGTAVINGQSVLAEQRIDADSGHGAHLFPLIKKSMSLAHVSFKKLEAIAVTVGPGSFTGLRVGLMTTKTIAYLNKLPVLGVTTLESLAYPVRAEAPLICVMLDALRGDVYFSVFRSQQGQLEPLIDVKLVTLQDALTEIVKVINEEGKSCVLVGNTVKEKKAILKTEIEKQVSTSLIFPLDEYHQISPAAVAELAQQKLEQGTLHYASALDIHPLYIRRPEAEIVYERKQQELNKKNQPE